LKRRLFLAALAAATLPSGVLAQRKPRRVALLAAVQAPHWSFLRDAMDATDILFDVQSADGSFNRLDKAAADIVRSRPDVIVAHGTPAVLAAAKATQRVPIIMSPASDPVGGANITGLRVDRALYAARVVNLIRELKPNARRIALLANADDPSTRALLGSLNEAAARIRVPVGIARVRSADDYEAAFAQWDRLRVQALIVQSTVDVKRSAELALRYRVPAISLGSGFVEAGGLLSYSEDPRELGRKTARYVDRLLKGAKPGQLPVEQVTAYDLALNLKVARAMELEFPDGVLARADAMVQ
jgi:putative tryptophan/tyrosine transport system substrate-binding protein